MAVAPAFSQRPAVSATPAVSMSESANRAPRCANANARLRPIPEPAPVITATLLSKFFIVSRFYSGETTVRPYLATSAGARPHGGWSGAPLAAPRPGTRIRKGRLFLSATSIRM
ncbi:Uncharacterised protein [Mycobacteroides abscessus subsp. abscessus]|nr:Uncharacterised protein [Mycobacteroides abscessus subsp. abscessus]SKV53003.1 Uncharacterised protein [Mycobacteroides abscessus subsp. abscessus]